MITEIIYWAVVAILFVAFIWNNWNEPIIGELTDKEFTNILKKHEDENN